MTRTLEQPVIAVGTEASFSKADRVTLLFEYRFSQEATWTPLDYTIDGCIVGGLQSIERPEDVFEPHVMPDRAIPEGHQYNTGHPFKLDENPFTQVLQDGSIIHLRYLAVHAEVIADADLRFTEAKI